MRCNLLIIIIFMPISSVAQETPLDAFEYKILSGADVKFTITSEGAVDSSLSGRLRYCDSKLTLDVRGELFDKRVRLKMRSEDGEFFINDDPEEEPSHLDEALVVGFVRMGLLHNVIRLGGNLVPDHADGGVRNWVEVPVVGRNSDKMFFDIHLSGKKAGRAELHLDESELPVERNQTMYFGGEEMKVVERYEIRLTCGDT